MPVHRRIRPIRAVGFAWFSALIIAAAAIGSLGSGPVRAEDEPPPTTTEEPTDDPPQNEQCLPPTDSAGPLPFGTQSISGHVTNSLGAALPEIHVVITSTSGGRDGNTVTDGNGDYLIPSLGDGTFFLGVVDGTATYGSGFFDGIGQPLAFTTGTATGIDLSGTGASGIDMEMPDETLGSISGTVTDANGPVSGVHLETQTLYFPLNGCATTIGDGTYTIPDLRRGGYPVRVSAPGQPSGFYTDANATGYTPSFTEATEVPVGGDITGINIQFPITYSLTGTVSDVDGPVEGISLTACLVTGDLCNGASSDATGFFEIPVLVEGSYRIFEQDGTGQNLYLSGYYAGEGQFSPDMDDATAVAVPGAAIDVLAVGAPTVSGTITNVVAEGIPGVSVNLCDEEQLECFYGLTDAAGDYTIGVTVPGTYVAQLIIQDIRYPNGGYVTAGGGVVSTDVGDARPIVSDGGNVVDVDAVIPDGGRVEMMFTSAGQPASFAAWGVCLDEFRCGVDGGNADFDGLATSFAIFPGTYYLSAAADIDFVFYVEGAVGSPDFGDADAFTITANSMTSITVDLPGPGAPTPEGQNVEVPLVDPQTGDAPVTLTFDEVTGGGTTSLTISGTGEPIPDGFQPGDPATYLDITTTATFDGQIEVCVSYAGVTFADPSGIRLYHFDATVPGWVDITSPPVNTIDQIVCGLTSSLSPFVLVERTYVFGGFVGIKPAPALNEAKAGTTIGVQFSLGGNLGLGVFAYGSPTFRQVNCSTGASMGGAAPASGSLKFNKKTGRYTYNWVTMKAWKNTCRELTLTFRDGSSQAVIVKLKP